MIAVSAGPSRRARLTLEPGRTLLDAVADALAAIGWPSATLRIFGGPMHEIAYHTSMLTPGGPRWIDYGPARLLSAPVSLRMASATYGTAREGGPALHCHASITQSGLTVGGHIDPTRTRIGDDGLRADAISGPAAAFRIHQEPSGFALLTPTPAHP